MGACYSRKASKSQSSSSFADHPRMATAKHEEVSSRSRPTPYSRSIPLANPNPASAKKLTFIPKPTESTPVDIKHHGRSSSIPRPTGPKPPLTTTPVEDLDTNSNLSLTLSESHHLINNNVQHLNTASPLKPKITAPSKKATLSQTPQTKIPSKLTAHLTGLPRPQTTQIMQKATSNDSVQDSENKPNSKNPHNRHDPSPDREEWDSGLGSSIIEKPSSAKAEDAETLKDADESLEGSPIIPKTSNNATVLKHILKFENISTLKEEEMVKKNGNSTKSSSLPLKQNSFNSPSTYRGVFNYSKSGESFKKSFTDYTASNGNNCTPPLTYGSYKNFLSYRKSLSSNLNFTYWHGIEDQKDAKEGSKIGKPSKLPSASLNNNSKTTIDNKVTSGSSVSAKEQPKTNSSRTTQSDNTENSTSTSLSPVVELENRQFLIDDEISDQPGLISFQQQQQQQQQQQHNSLKESVSELQALKAVAACPSPAANNSDMFSSCSSLCSDDLMLENDRGDKVRVRPIQPRPRSLGCEPRLRSTSMPLRPPRQMTITEQDDGCVRIDASSYRLLCQDLNSVKTMLHRLKSIIYDAETLNPFDQVSGSKNVFYQSMAHHDLPVGCPLPSPHLEEHKTDLGFVQQGLSLLSAMEAY